MSATLLTMVFAHLLCNALANDQPLQRHEAYFCSANFEELKVTLKPNLTFDAFNRMGTKEKAMASVQSYQFYRDWLADNAYIVSVMQQSIGPLVRNESSASLGQ